MTDPGTRPSIVQEGQAPVLLDPQLQSPPSRRAFLRSASALTLTIPGIGAALTACSMDRTQGQSDTGAAHDAAQRDAGVPNPDSRLDSVLPGAGGNAAASAAAVQGTAAAVLTRVDPALPALSSDRTLRLAWHAREAPVRISADTVVAGWTFEGNIPGPVVHCRVGDTVEFTLTNDAAVPHSMDFHAAQIDPRTAFRSAPKGESVSFSFTPKYAGAFLYHCGTAPVLMHIGAGMFGAIVVSPREPMPPAKEFVLVENEYYLGAAVNGVRPSDYTRMLSTLPDLVCFNGRPEQYIREPIRVNRGDRVRFWVVNAGPTHPCAFHVVGEQFDSVWLGAPPANPLHGVQTFSVAAGGGMAFELVCDVPGDFPFVNHAFGHGQKGSIGILSVGS
jgi:nitrite reductase (NO-forming)